MRTQLRTFSLFLQSITFRIKNWSQLQLKKRSVYVYNGSLCSDSSRYDSNHKTIEKKGLESPYETNCLPYKDFGFHGRDQCIEDCVSKQVWSSLRRISLLSPVLEANDSTPLSRVSLRNQTNYATFLRIQKHCESKTCKKQDCLDVQYVTETESSLFDCKKFGRVFSWNHRVFSQISYRITSTASLPFFEFLIYILSSISTWTGLSIVACNPVLLGQHLLKEYKTRNKTQPQSTKPIIQGIIDYHKISNILSSHEHRFSELEEKLKSFTSWLEDID